MTAATDALGLGPDARAVIVNCDELGFSDGANVAIYQALHAGTATSATVMIPAPWARSAAADYDGEDVGVHLTLNAELDRYRWGPITHAPSLLDGDGAFPRTVDDVWEHADLEEVRREWRAQIERAQLWGFSVHHLDAHLGGVELKPEFFDAYLDLADEFALAVRLPGPEEERRIGFPFRALAEERGVLAPDRVVTLRSLGEDATSLAEAIAAFEPGVTEVHAHPAIDSSELHVATPEWESRVRERALLAALPAAFVALGAKAPTRIGYRALTEAMRSR